MAVTTITPAPAKPHPGRRVRTALATACQQAVTMAGAARHRLRRPALVIGGLGCMDASAWHTFGLGAGLLALGASCWVFELLIEDDQPDAPPDRIR